MDEKMLLQAIGQLIDEKMDTKLQPIMEDIQAIKNRTLKLEITLENETNRNIQLLMEGHAQLVDDNKEIMQKIEKIDHKLEDMDTRLFATETATKENIRHIAVLEAEAK